MPKLGMKIYVSKKKFFGSQKLIIINFSKDPFYNSQGEIYPPSQILSKKPFFPFKSHFYRPPLPASFRFLLTARRANRVLLVKATMRGGVNGDGRGETNKGRERTQIWGEVEARKESDTRVY